MPRSNGRPLNRLNAAQKAARLRRMVGEYREYVKRRSSLKEAAEQCLADRRDYRQTLIHRLASAYGDRYVRIEQTLQDVEQQIRELRAVAA